MEKEKVYKFKGIAGLYADSQGNFFYKDAPAKKIYNNGTLSVLCGRKKRGIKKLRSLAYVSFVTPLQLPF